MGPESRQAGPDTRVRTSANCLSVRCHTHALAVGALSDTRTLVLARNRQRRVHILGKHATFLFEDFSAGTCSAVIRPGFTEALVPTALFTRTARAMSSPRKHNGSEPHHRILLLEGSQRDGEMVTQTLRANSHTAEVLRVESTAAFAEALETFEPDVVVTGTVAGLNSRDALQMSRQRHPEVPVLLIAETLDRSIVDSLRAGAADFVSKNELEKLPSAVDTALAQRAPLRRLSRRQREVFRLLASGVTMRDIASQLGLSRKTVETHRSAVMHKLDLHSPAAIVRYAISNKLVEA